MSLSRMESGKLVEKEIDIDTVIHERNLKHEHRYTR